MTVDLNSTEQALLHAVPDLPPDDYTADNWRVHAACRGLDPDLFYPPVGGAATEAKQVCRACPVSDFCLEDALIVNPRDDHGVWGGTSTEERKRLRKQRGLSQTVTIRRDTTRPVAGCGTNAGYQRHRRYGEPVCDACRHAHNRDKHYREATR